MRPPTPSSSDKGRSAVALKRALNILTRRDHTRRELARKLDQKGFAPADIEAVLDRCERLGYLDDARTAEMMTRQLVARGYGPLRIRYTLVQKGVAEGLIQRAMICCGDERDQLRRARRLLEKKRRQWQRETDPVKRRLKARRYLVGRGYPQPIVDQALESL